MEMIVTLPAFTMVGLGYHGQNKNGEIGQMWGEFLARLDEVERINPTISYGVCSVPAGLPEGHFEYVAGVQVEPDAAVPAGMVKRSLPMLQYAVFAHRGVLKDLRKTYQRIYEEELPKTGLELYQPGLDMELYTSEWLGDTPDSVLYIYIPIK